MRRNSHTTLKLALAAGMACALSLTAIGEPDKAADTADTTEQAEQTAAPIAPDQTAAKAKQLEEKTRRAFGRIGPKRPVVDINDPDRLGLGEPNEWEPVRAGKRPALTPAAPAPRTPAGAAGDSAVDAITGAASTAAPPVGQRVPIIQLEAQPEPSAEGERTPTKPGVPMVDPLADPFDGPAFAHVATPAGTLDIANASEQEVDSVLDSMITKTAEIEPGPVVEANPAFVMEPLAPAAITAPPATAQNTPPAPDTQLAGADGPQYDRSIEMQPLMPARQVRPAYQPVAAEQAAPARTPAVATQAREPMVDLVEPGRSADLAQVAPVLPEVAVRRPVAAAAAIPASQPVGAPIQESQALTAAPGSGWVSEFGWIIKGGGALLLVLGLIFALAWVYRLLGGANAGLGAVMGGKKAPSGIVEMLGRYPVGPRQSLVLLKFDRRVLLLNQTAGGKGGSNEMTTLCELTDPEDVASVLIKVRDASGDSANHAFQEAISRAELTAGATEREAMNNRQPEVVQGHHQPFAGSGGSKSELRRVIEGAEGDRAELWGDAPTKLSDDPVGPLRRKISAFQVGPPKK